MPEPVDADARLADSDGECNRGFERLVSDVVATLERMHGEPSVVAPRRSGSPSWMARLARALRLVQSHEGINPDKLAPGPALTSAATSDSYLEFASVEFGRSGSEPGLAMTFTADAHPIIWIWLHDSVAASWSALVQAVTRDWPCSEARIAWESLMPAKPFLSIELPRARLHRGDSACWSDGSRALGFQAGLGVHPHEVYLPTESAWAAAAPAWAATLRGVIVRDFEQMRVRVVESPNATVRDGHPET